MHTHDWVTKARLAASTLEQCTACKATRTWIVQSLYDHRSFNQLPVGRLMGRYVDGETYWREVKAIK